MPVSRRAGKKAAKKAAKQVEKQEVNGLTPKQQLFVAAYLANGLNATAAAKAAGYSTRTAESQASRLLKVPAVARAIAEQQEKRLGDLEVTGERVIQELAKVGFAKGAYLLDEDGQLQFEVKLKEKVRALELLGKNQKLFTEKVEHSGKVQLEWVAELSDEELAARLEAHGVASNQGGK